MRALLSILLAASLGRAAAAGFSTVEINGNSFSNISRVYTGAGGKVIVAFEGGATTASADKIPADFLKSWGIDKAGAKATESATAANALERAIQAGSFREVDGVVYDTRRAAGWVRFNNCKVLQILDGAAIVDATPGANSFLAIYVKHLSSAVGDTDFISFAGLPVGSHSYVNKKGDDRTIRAYDLGRACSRSEIPETVLNGQKTSDMALIAGAPQTDVVATLPESGDLVASGSGFFITEDGYLITNHHVVKGAKRVKVKQGEKVYPATVIREDKAADLALLKVAGEFKALPISTNAVRLGDGVFTIGFPDIGLQGTQPKYTDGKISSLAGLRDDPDKFQISVPVQPGNSGGPLVDMAGNVLGVIVSRLNDFAALRSTGSLPQNVNYAVRGDLLRKFIAQTPGIATVATSATASGSAVATVQDSVAIILVY